MKKLHIALLGVILMIQSTTVLIAKTKIITNENEFLNILIDAKECMDAKDFVACTAIRQELRKKANHLEHTPDKIVYLEKLAARKHHESPCQIKRKSKEDCALSGDGCSLTKEDLTQSFLQASQI